MTYVGLILTAAVFLGLHLRSRRLRAHRADAWAGALAEHAHTRRQLRAERDTACQALTDAARELARIEVERAEWEGIARAWMLRAAEHASRPTVVVETDGEQVVADALAGLDRAFAELTAGEWT